MAGAAGSAVKPGEWHASHQLPIQPYLIHPELVSKATANSLPIIFILKDSHPSCLGLGSLPNCHTNHGSRSQVEQ